MFIKYRTFNIDSHCQFNCPFCDLPRSYAPDCSTQQIIEQLEKIVVGANVLLSGGELFLREDANNIIKAASARFRRVKVITNGEPLADESLFHSAVSAGLRMIEFIFFSTDSETHNKITGTDSHERVMQGLNNVSMHAAIRPETDTSNRCGNDFFFSVRIPFLKENATSVAETVSHIVNGASARIILDCRPCNGISDAVLEELSKCLEIAEKAGVCAMIAGLPPCILREKSQFCLDLYRLEKNLPGYRFVDSCCPECVLKPVCAGVPERLAAQWNRPHVSEKDCDIPIEDLLHLYDYVKGMV